MTDIQIKSVEVAEILRTQKPKEKYDALVHLFKSIEASIASHESTVSINNKHETVSDSSENLLSDVPEVLSNSTEKLSSSDDVVSLSDRDETPTPSENSVKYVFYNEEGEKRTLSFVGGSLLKVKSNKGNDRIICVSANEFASGCGKKVYSVDWQISIKADGCNFYKPAPNYVWASFFLIQTQNEANVSKEIDKASKEVGLYKLFYPKTKQLCEIKSPLSQYGFMMPNLGTDLVNLVMYGDYSEEDRAEIAHLLIEEFKSIFKAYEKVHCDLKLENVCYNPTEKKVSFIDLDGITSIYDLLKERPTVTPEYLSQFLFDEEKEEECDNTAILCLGQYRIIHSLWTLVATCARLIYGQHEIEDEYFLEKLEQLDDYFKNLQTESRSLTQEEIITKTKKLALEFIISFDNELCSQFGIVPPSPENSLIPLPLNWNRNGKKDIEDNSRKRTRTDAFQFWIPDKNGGNDSEVEAAKRKKENVILDSVGDPEKSLYDPGSPTFGRG